MVAEALSDITDKEVLSVKIDISQSIGAGLEHVTTLVTPATGKKVVVIGLQHLMIGSPGAANTQAQFRSDTTDLTGVITGNSVASPYMSFINSGYMPDGHFWTARDESLKIAVINGGVATKTCIIAGALQYYEE